ncbi:MAG TPA: hypothetical protein PKX32_00110 [Candidatus Saccharicenans sp.]|nr:hypothetical protein [Candidatus Saccharicenans sp.]
MELSQIIYGLAIIILAAFIAREKIREIKLTRQRGLKANPERCAIHETKINQLQVELNEFKRENEQDHDRIFQALDNVRERLTRVEAKLNGSLSR